MHPVEKLYREVRKKKVSLISRILGEKAGAEDVVQEAFCRAWKYWPSYNEELGSIETWFNSLLFNALSDYKKRSRMVYQETGEVSANDLLTEDYLKKHERIISALIGNVKNDKHRRVLELFYLLGYTSREIAEMELGVSETNVRTIARRFRDKIVGVG